MGSRSKGVRRVALTLRLEAVEGELFAPDAHIAPLIRRAAQRLNKQLAPRLPLLVEDGPRVAFQNLIGTVRLNDTMLVEVAPKVDAGEDWVRATLDLLDPGDPIDVAGDRLAGLAPRHRNLLDALAASYAQRLGRAMRRDGPLLVLERRSEELPVLRGKLRATAYLRSAPVRPHRFPVTFDSLSADNDFTKAMAVVAGVLQRATTSSATASALAELRVGLRPGSPEFAAINPAVVSRPLPAQWSVYRPAWSIAIAILSNSSLLRSTGLHRGVEVAIEAWPLLEHLLERGLQAAQHEAAAKGRTVSIIPKQLQPLLTNPGHPASPRGVEPDGQLAEAGVTIATFEAKYSPGPLARGWPPRSHIFQALSTAAACDSPLAVLVYPRSFAPIWWDVAGLGRPSHLAAIGLGLFSYRRGNGDVAAGQALSKLLAGRPSP